MIKILSAIAFVSLFFAPGMLWAADYEKASEIQTARLGDVVVRYVKVFESPCLDVQVLDPNKQWALISERNFCSYGSKSLLKDFSYAAFEKVSFASDGIHVNLSLTPLALSEDEVHACIIPVAGSTIKDLTCSNLKGK